MDLQARFNAIVARHHWWDDGERIVIAVSTGVDSMVLLHLVEHLTRKRPEIIVAYVDHQLREQSRQESHYIRAYCRDHQLQLQETAWPIEQHPKSGVEAAARAFRYDWFNQLLRKYQANVLLTAHHGDDLAETVLMKWVRGGQLNALSGIQESRQFRGATMVRPLLSFSKQELYDFAVAADIRWFEDQTNQELQVERNRIRHQVVPVLKQENPHMLDHVLEYSIQIQETLNVVRELTAPIVDQAVTVTDFSQPTIDLNVLSRYSQSVVRVVLQSILEDRLHFKDVSQKQLDMLYRLATNPARPQGQLYLEGGWRVVRSYQQLTIVQEDKIFAEKSKIKPDFMVILDRWYSIDETLKIGVFRDDQPFLTDRVYHFDLADSDFPLRVRPANANDQIALTNGGHQRVNRVLINAKIPSIKRNQTSVLVTASGTVLSVLGVKATFYRSVAETTHTYFLVERHVDQ
ncbi:tRNA lysidine(34) synthetase TilS [Lentilactobacillus parabuchneri]|uniref:tRNA lysidine(34) synthetase TilS n=1 Tax=Lentilactobacillus parabuchneri TaxID=152331 RepID=UPI0021A4086E|nr:tRNA lysidine(34) synthetase TilS [Lentilactobacillus parabuchneri]